jgi:hypothetical protein
LVKTWAKHSAQVANANAVPRYFIDKALLDIHRPNQPPHGLAHLRDNRRILRPQVAAYYSLHGTLFPSFTG